MTRRILAVGLAVLAVTAGVAQAATKPSKHKISETLALRVLTGDSHGATFTGTGKDKALGIVAYVIKATGSASATNKIQGVAFFKDGTIVVKGTVKTTTRADGSGFDYAGTASILAGTGRFKNASGKVKLVGSATSQDPAYQTYTATGTVTY